MLILILANPIFYSKRALYSRTDYEGDQTIVSHKLDDINILTSLVDSKREQTKYKLAYSPDTPFVKRVVDVVTSVLELNNSIGYNDPETLQNQFDERTMLAAVVFDRLDQDPDAIPKVLSVSIRFPSEFRTISPFLTEDRLWLTRCSGVVNSKRDNAKDSDINQDIYIREGFLQLQHQVFLAWFHMLRSQDPSKATEPQTEVFNVRLRVANERCSTMDFDAIPSFLFNFIYLLPFINVIRSMAAQMKDNVMTHQWHYGYSFCKQYTCIMIVLMLRLLCLGLIIMFATFIYWSVVDGIFSPIALLSLIVFVIIITLELILTAIIIAKIFKDVVNAQSDWDSDRYKSECKKWLDLIETHIAERWQPIDTLTYGEKRVVALCCAIAGDTKLIVFEEPTKDMTAREAKIFWNIVSAEKEDHAFLVATHSIDETDAIADRIGILSMGVLEASGTPFFLRSKFSSFVELIIIKKPHVSDTPITDFIANYIPETEPENEIGDTLTYKINARHRPRLQKMLIHLENERKKLGIENVQVVGSEMSDIYMKLATSFRLQQQIIPDVTQTFKYSVVSKKKLKKQQVRAMFYKKMIHTAPNVWPVVMIFSCFFLIVVITRLAIVLNVPNVRKNSIPIGFLGSEEFLKTIPNINNCGYIEIKTVTNVPTYRKANGLSRTFDANSFSCEQGQYRHTLAKKVELTSLGAVEQGGQQDISGYISQDTFHSAPMLLNLLHNIIIQLSYTNKTDYATLVDSHPMPTPLTMKINLLDNEIAHINAPLAVGCILPLVISIFIIPIVEEHICGLRVLQVIAGLRLQIYWGVNLLWDIFTYLIYSIIIVIIVACTNVGDFGIIENLMLLLLLFVYGLAALPITYVVSMYMNRSMVRAFLVSVLFQGLTGLVLYIVYWDVANSNVIFFYGACLSPGFSLLDGISNIYIRCLEKRLCQTKCAAVKNCQPHNMHEMVPRCNFDTYFKWADSGVLPALTFMILASAIALLLIFWIELHRREKKFHSSKNLNNMRTATYHFDDSDVADVKQKIAEADMSKCKQSVFLVDQVEAKIPAKGNRLNTISFALNKYMSMGIFGPRRSGKSHLIRQLVGVDGFAFGEIYVRGLDFKYDIDTILGYVGYCPQHYGLLNELTPREHIRLLCMIRGVPEDKIKEKIHDICLMLNMTGWMHRKCGVLTPEKRRKVNVSLSLVAYNKIFILDEPTCGMPSTTRREIWNILRYLRYCGKTIIFASNDELECKVLADFVVLFQDSEMLAIGSMQYLRYKYSHGFYLEVRLVRDGSTKEESEANLRKDVENLARFIHFLHDKAEVVGHMHNWFKYYIPVGHIVYSFLYGALEKNKVRLNIYDYSIYGANMNIVIAQVQETRAELKRKMEPKVDNDDRVKRSTNKFFSHLYH
ncbi:hypothetical protein AWZ03_013570 [Drosophila navojoa]|uniref:ABC transporter domain-containing protein n=1 Tax=Drosophila navojoa TaxID=7232 RepID=A0A484AWS5_DRONA|nr:hypothetical protein AWZ03_013570 [Drosophila navojoa]